MVFDSEFQDIKAGGRSSSRLLGLLFWKLILNHILSIYFDLNI
jgi:hypothetical protein